MQLNECLVIQHRAAKSRLDAEGVTIGRSPIPVLFFLEAAFKPFDSYCTLQCVAIAAATKGLRRPELFGIDTGYQCCRDNMLLPRLLRRSAQQCSPPWGIPSLRFRSLARPSWQRSYSLRTDDTSIKNLPGLDPSKLSITETITPKELVPPEELIFGRTFTGTALPC
jgi:hypothetical protein